MITCDYLIIGSGFAGIGLKYKLLGKTVLIDKNPFQYKIGESQVPNLINEDQGILSLIPKIVKMKSFTRKLGTIFCDSYHGKYATSFPTALGTPFAFHAEREELERLLVKELAVEIKKEVITDIDLSKNIVVTNKNTYRFRRYLLDCSGPAMVIANKLNLVTPVNQFKGMKAQWSYWAIDDLNNEVDSWANWTTINKIGQDSWIWQIPIYNSTILSMGLLHRGEAFSPNDLIEYLQQRAAACYRLTSIFKNPQRAIKPYMKEVYCRLHYSKRSSKCTGKNWILVGDACCFADPVYSTGSGVAMLQAITIANILNKNNGRFDHEWYEKRCDALLKTVIDGIGTWYSGSAFNKKVNEKVNRTILQGGFSRHFHPSKITEDAQYAQLDNLKTFLSDVPTVDQFSEVYSRTELKVYYFNEKCFRKKKSSLFLAQRRLIRMTNKNVQKMFEKHLIGKRLSYSDLYLLSELNLKTLKERNYFWKIIRFIELLSQKNRCEDHLYYFHPEKYETIDDSLKLGEGKNSLMIDNPLTIRFFEKVKSRMLFGKEIMKLAKKMPESSQNEVMNFIKTFYYLDTFGRNFCLAAEIL